MEDFIGRKTEVRRLERKDKEQRTETPVDDWMNRMDAFGGMDGMNRMIPAGWIRLAGRPDLRDVHK